jgi:hypothetical protein
MKYFIFILVVVYSSFLISCETVVTFDLPINQTKLVVEGSIENDAPPLVFLSISFPFFGDVDFNNLDELLVRDAIITVTEGVNSVELIEYGKDELIALSADDFATIAPIIEQVIGFPIDQETLDTFYNFIPNFSFYTVKPADFGFVGELGKTYDLKIELTDDARFGTAIYTASTNISYPISLDSLWVEDHPNEENDTLFQLKARLDDPDTTGNFYRYYTSVNGGPFLTSNTSVFDDLFIDGESVPLTIFKGQTEREKLEDPDFEVDGYWAPGDTALVKLSMINNDHYQFWRTVENEKNNLGSPFGSYTIIQSNIVGDRAVGIWGGYGSTTLSIIIPEL